MNTPKTIASGLALLIFSSSAQAVTIVDTFFDSGGTSAGLSDPPPLVAEGGGVYSYTFTSLGTFVATGSDKLVLGFQNKDTGAVTGPPVLDVTYGGAAMTQAIQQASGRQRNSIFYLDNVASDGNLVVRFTDGGTSNQASWTLGLYALNGTAAGVNDTATERHLSAGGDLNDGGASVNVSTDTGFVLNLYARNNGNLNFTSPTPPFTVDADSTVPTDGGALAHLYASAVVNASGDYFTVASGHGGGTPQSTMVAAAFNAAPPVAIPEPSTTALLGLGALGLILRRRK